MRENWHRALDIQMDLQKYSRTAEGAAYHYHFAHALFKTNPRYEDQQFATDVARDLPVVLHRADTIYVTEEMESLLLQAAHDLPWEYEFDPKSLLSPFGFVYLERSIVGVDVHGDSVTVKGFAWQVVPSTVEGYDGLRQTAIIYFFSDPNDPNDIISTEVIPKWRENGDIVPPLILAHLYIVSEGIPMKQDDRQGAALVLETGRLFLALNLLSHQTIGEPMKMRPNRATRKRAISWDRDNERYITLITLRRKSVKKDDEEHQKIEWSHRWVVRGHWRRQYFPKTKTHDWVYIYEHIKGPEDKPLLISERRIFNFKR